MKAETIDTSGPTRRITRFASGLRCDDATPEMIERLKLLMLESLGCGHYGARRQRYRMLRETLETVDDAREVGLWGSGHALTARKRPWSTARRCTGSNWTTCTAPA